MWSVIGCMVISLPMADNAIRRWLVDVLSVRAYEQVVAVAGSDLIGWFSFKTISKIHT